MWPISPFQLCSEIRRIYPSNTDLLTLSRKNLILTSSNFTFQLGSKDSKPSIECRQAYGKRKTVFTYIFRSRISHIYITSSKSPIECSNVQAVVGHFNQVHPGVVYRLISCGIFRIDQPIRDSLYKNKPKKSEVCH